MKNSEIMYVKVEIPVLKRHRKYIAKALNRESDLATVEDVREYVITAFSFLMGLWAKKEQEDMNETEQK